MSVFVFGARNGAIYAPSPTDDSPLRMVVWSWPEPTLRTRYLHFTTEEGQRTILESRRLVADPHEWFFGRGCFAVREGGRFQPGPGGQRGVGRAATHAVLLRVDRLPDWCSPFEACWRGPTLPLREVEAIGYQQAAGLLDRSLRQIGRLPDGSLLGAPAGYRPLPRSPLEQTIPDVRGLYELLTSHEPGVFVACCSPLHGERHWRQVAATGLELAKHTPGADPGLVFAFAMLHDAFRQHDRADPGHGLRAAEALDELCADDWLRLDGRQQTILFEALADHPHGRTTLEPTIGCCWDADRLDLGRCGIIPDPALLSTVAASNACSTGRDSLTSAAGRRQKSPSWRELWEVGA